MDAVTAITIGLWDFVLGIGGVVVVFCVVLLTAGAMLLRQLDLRSAERDAAHANDLATRDKVMEGRLDGQDEELARVNTKTDQIEREVRSLSALLPNEYVRREDWIRFSVTIDTKLDWLRENQEDTRNSVTALASTLNAKSGGQSNGR